MGVTALDFNLITTPICIIWSNFFHYMQPKKRGVGHMQQQFRTPFWKLGVQNSKKKGWESWWESHPKTSNLLKTLWQNTQIYQVQISKKKRGGGVIMISTLRVSSVEHLPLVYPVSTLMQIQTRHNFPYLIP